MFSPEELIKDVTLISEQAIGGTHQIEAGFLNREEPEQWDRFMVRITRDGKTGWQVNAICSFHTIDQEYQDVGNLYSSILVEGIKDKVLTDLQKH